MARSNGILIFGILAVGGAYLYINRVKQSVSNITVAPGEFKIKSKIKDLINRKDLAADLTLHVSNPGNVAHVVDQVKGQVSYNGVLVGNFSTEGEIPIAANMITPVIVRIQSSTKAFLDQLIKDFLAGRSFGKVKILGSLRIKSLDGLQLPIDQTITLQSE